MMMWVMFIFFILASATPPIVTLRQKLDTAVIQAAERALLKSFERVPVYPNLTRFFPFVEEAILQAAKEGKQEMQFPRGIMANDSEILEWEMKHGDKNVANHYVFENAYGTDEVQVERRRVAMDEFVEEWNKKHPKVCAHNIKHYILKITWDLNCGLTASANGYNLPDYGKWSYAI